MSTPTAASRVVFLPVPEKLTFLEQNIPDNNLPEGFRINPNIPIPVEISKDSEKYYNEGILNMENLSIDMILSGMLRVIETGEAEQEWLDYYSHFVLFLRPDILTKLKEIKDNGLNEKDFLKAHSLIHEGNIEEGLKYTRNFLKRRPLVWNGWFLLGWALRLLNRWKDGEAALRKAIELGGSNSDTRNELAICLMETGNIAAAKQELESALKEDPENAKIISNLGVLTRMTNPNAGGGLLDPQHE